MIARQRKKQSQFARNVITKFMEINRLTITTESRILGDEYVRFGGEYIETCFHKGKKGALLASHWSRKDAYHVYRSL